MNFDDYYSTKEVAEKLGISSRSVARKARKGDLDGKLIGRTWFISKASVEAYLETVKGLDKHDPRRGKRKPK